MTSKPALAQKRAVIYARLTIFADRLLDRVGMTLLPSGVLTRKESGGTQNGPSPSRKSRGLLSARISQTPCECPRRGSGCTRSGREPERRRRRLAGACAGVDLSASTANANDDGPLPAIIIERG
jgi:hypothetical protein